MSKIIKFLTSSTGFLALQRYVRVVEKDSINHHPGVVFVNGFKSVIGGRKVAALQQWAINRNVDFLAYDHYAHGQSSGEFKDATVGRWFEDLCLLLEKETKGPQILVGSSMGFWLALLVVLRGQSLLSRRITGLIGIAPIVNFTEGMTKEMTQTQLEVAGGAGVYRRQSDYFSTGYCDIPISLLVEGKRHCVVAPFEIDIPIRLIHGLQDSDVSYTETLGLMKDLQSDNVDLLLVKDGDHRLSRDEDLERITFLLDNLLGQLGMHTREDEPVVWRDNPLQRCYSTRATPQ